MLSEASGMMSISGDEFQEEIQDYTEAYVRMGLARNAAISATFEGDLSFMDRDKLVIEGREFQIRIAYDQVRSARTDGEGMFRVHTKDGQLISINAE